MSATCYECDAPADHHHHVIPRSLGGRRTVPLCGACHSRAHGLDGQTWTGHRELTRAALAALAASGRYTGGTVPYGQRLAADGLHLEEDPAEAEVLTVARELRAAGASLRAVGAELAARGMAPRGGGRWSAAAVGRLIEAAEAAEAR